MKNRSIISFLFSFIMLVVLSMQFAEHFNQVSVDEQTIELSDWDDETEMESEEDSEEKTMSWIQHDFVTKELFDGKERSHRELIHILQVLIKIPSPPPKLA